MAKTFKIESTYGFQMQLTQAALVEMAFELINLGLGQFGARKLFGDSLGQRLFFLATLDSLWRGLKIRERLLSDPKSKTHMPLGSFSLMDMSKWIRRSKMETCGQSWTRDDGTRVPGETPLTERKLARLMKEAINS